MRANFPKLPVSLPSCIRCSVVSVSRLCSPKVSLWQKCDMKRVTFRVLRLYRPIGRIKPLLRSKHLLSWTRILTSNKCIPNSIICSYSHSRNVHSPHLCVVKKMSKPTNFPHWNIAVWTLTLTRWDWTCSVFSTVSSWSVLGCAGCQVCRACCMRVRPMTVRACPMSTLWLKRAMRLLVVSWRALLWWKWYVFLRKGPSRPPPPLFPMPLTLRPLCTLGTLLIALTAYSWG